MTTEPWVSVEDVVKHLGGCEGLGVLLDRVAEAPGAQDWHLWKFKLSDVDEWVRAEGADRYEGERDDER